MVAWRGQSSTTHFCQKWLLFVPSCGKMLIYHFECSFVLKLLHWQCDQISRFIGFEQIFVKVSKYIIFLVKLFLGNFYGHLAIFFWSHWSLGQFNVSGHKVSHQIPPHCRHGAICTFGNCWRSIVLLNCTWLAFLFILQFGRQWAGKLFIEMVDLKRSVTVKICQMPIKIAQ